MTKRVMGGMHNIQRKMFDMHGEICNMLGKVTCAFKSCKYS
jgi:hypothetical protein